MGVLAQAERENLPFLHLFLLLRSSIKILYELNDAYLHGWSSLPFLFFFFLLYRVFIAVLRLLLFQGMGSRACMLSMLGLSSCQAQAELSQGMWDLSSLTRN